MSEETSLLMDIETHYEYIVEGKTETITLPVDEKDVIINADGEIDCPFDTVLRKNNYTFNDLNEWDAREIKFVKRRKETETVIQSIPLNVNL